MFSHTHITSIFQNERLIKIFFSLLLYVLTAAADDECRKYVFRFPNAAAAGTITVAWDNNRVCYGTASAKQDLKNTQFIIKVESLFGDDILIDTCRSNYYTFNTSSASDEPFVFQLMELGSSDGFQDILISPEKVNAPLLKTRIDSLNYYLLNGYFMNAQTIMNKMDSMVSNKILDALHFDSNLYNKSYSNCYVDSLTSAVVKMPDVDGIAAFNKQIQKFAKNDFTVVAKISADDKLLSYEVRPSGEYATFSKAANLLSFSNASTSVANVYLKISRNKKNRYVVVNEKALTRPQWKDSVKMPAAIH